MKKSLKRFSIVTGLALSVVLAGCGNSTKDNEGESSISDKVKHTITAIEPGAGIVQATENAVEEYDSLSGWKIETSSSGAMVTQLDDAIKNKEPIVITGWTPHWMFQTYDLKYLDDPKKVFGEEESIHTMVRKGLKEDNPEAYLLLDQFNWEISDMESVMLEIQNDVEPKTAAENWVKANSDKVAEWTKGVNKSDGKEIQLSYVEWDSEVASTNVVGKVLEDLGFKVKITPLDNAIMWESVSQGDTDAMVAAWLPGTHGDLYEAYKDKLEDLGENLKGAKIGLVVPEYMDINSIEDLEPKK